MLSCECIPVVVKLSEGSYSPVDINTMSTVPEDPEYPSWKVSDILTNPTSDMKVHDIIID